MITLACASCQMQRLGPDFLYILLWLVPGVLCYLAATTLDGKSSKSASVVNAILFLLGFVVCLGIMPLLLVLMIPFVVILLLVKLASKSPHARVAALIGLAPLGAILLTMKLQQRASGVYYPIDRTRLSENLTSHEVNTEKDPFGLTQTQLLEALHTGPETRNHNARKILLAQVKSSSEANTFDDTASQIQAMSQSRIVPEDFVREYQEALGAAAWRQEQAEAESESPSTTQSGEKKPRTSQPSAKNAGATHSGDKKPAQDR